MSKETELTGSPQQIGESRCEAVEEVLRGEKLPESAKAAMHKLNVHQVVAHSIFSAPKARDVENLMQEPVMVFSKSTSMMQYE